MIRLNQIPAAQVSRKRFGPFTSVITATALASLAIVMVGMIFR